MIIFSFLYIIIILIIIDSDREASRTSYFLKSNSGDSDEYPHNELLGHLWIVCQSELFVTIHLTK